MRGFVRRSAAFAAAAVLVIGVFAAPQAAAAPTRGHAGFTHRWVTPELVDTDRVIGFPQYWGVGTARGPAARVRTARPGAASTAHTPVITTEPVSTTVAAGDVASFDAAASGSPTPSAQWQVSTSGGRRWAAIRGATGDSYSVRATASMSGREYRAVFRNRYGTATTEAATLTVTTTAPAAVAPQVTTQPSAQAVTVGQTATFTAVATGTPIPTVQWEVSGAGSWAVVSDGAQIDGSVVSGATSTTLTITGVAAFQSGNEYRAVFTNSAGTATSDAATLTVSRPVPTSTVTQSSNWSGYAAVDATFSQVSGSWTVPQVTCSQAATDSAQWVGIDGAGSSTVEQTGTEANCSGGKASFDAWYEMYGDSSVNRGYEVELDDPVTKAPLPVEPGDVMTASVSVAGSTWTIAIGDATEHWTAVPTVIGFAGAAQTSAEWVVERPDVCGSSGCRTATLTAFVSVPFTGASAVANGQGGPIDATDTDEIQMVDSGAVIADPGPLTAAGDGFADTYTGPAGAGSLASGARL